MIENAHEANRTGGTDVRGGTVAVVIPTYNYACYLGEAIESVLAQSVPVQQLLVVDDGSTDEPDKIAGQFAEVTFLRKSNGGLASARNFALRFLASDFVLFLDADDTLTPTYVEECLNALNSEDERAAYAYTQADLFGALTGVTTYPSFSAMGLKQQNIVHASALIRVAVFDCTQYDERLRSGHEDWDFYLSLLERGLHGVLVDAPLLRYRQHDLSMMTSLRSRVLRLYGTMLYVQTKHRRLYGRQEFLRQLMRLLWTCLRDVAARGPRKIRWLRSKCWH